MGWFRKPRPDLVRTVRQDWHAPLTDDKNLVYGIGINTVTWSYDIFGMELNEGLASLRRGHADFAREHAVVSAHLCDRFVHPLGRLDLRARAARSALRHATFGRAPSCREFPGRCGAPSRFSE